MKQAYYSKRKEQEQKCNYCQNIENQANILERNIDTIERFRANHIEGVNGVLAPSNETLYKDAIQMAMQLEPLKRKIEQCQFPNCGACRNEKD
jgi:hypothetical protein